MDENSYDYKVSRYGAIHSSAKSAFLAAIKLIEKEKYDENEAIASFNEYWKQKTEQAKKEYADWR